MASPSPRRRPGHGSFRPIASVEVELSRPIPDLVPEPVGRYGAALVLVRVHGRPIGFAHVPLPDGGLGAADLAATLWFRLCDEVTSHLVADGLPAPLGLDRYGLPTGVDPACVVDRVRRIGDPPLASVIIATRDRPASLACCLASLGQLAYPRTEIVVVDNCPTTDETAELVDRWTGTGQRIRYVREPRPGLAVAHNRGVQEARGDVLAFTDDDVLVDRWWLDELVAGFGAADGVGCVTGLITAAELETPAQVWAERHWGLGKGFTRTVVDLHDQRPPGRLFPYAAGTLGSGANMAFSAAALWSIGGFDAVLGTGTRAMGGDDLAAFYRTVVNGHGLVYEPAAIVRHSGHQGAAALRRQAYGYGVGLTAYLTSIVAHDPTTLARVLPRIPAAVGHAVSPRRPAPSPFVSPPGARPAPGVVARRWLGMACGPMAYARSRRWARRLDAFERMPSVSNASAATEDEACPPFPG